MDIQLYKNNSPNDYVNKSLTLLTTKTVTPVGMMDLLTPTFKLSGFDISDCLDCNYCYVPEYGRFYYCKITLGPDGIFYISCTVDPLMSFKSEYLVLDAIVNKLETGNDQFINDGSFVVASKNFTSIYNYSTGFNDSPQNILICAGG